MKKELRLPLLLTGLLFLVVSACRVDWDDGGYVRKPAAGRVLEYGTLTPIADAVVSVGCIPGASCGVLDTTRSDADGHYAFPEVENDGLLLVNAFKDAYFTDYMTAKSVLDYSEEQTDIILPPYAWLEVTIRNESGAYEFNGPGSDLSGGSQSYHLQQGQEAIITGLGKGNQDYKFLFSIYVQPGEPLQDLQAIQILKEDGTFIEATFQNSISPWFPVYLTGHNTTKITIIF